MKRRPGLPKAIKDAVLSAHNGRCAVCGEVDDRLVFDHLIPYAWVLSHEENNIQPLCLSCHKAKTRHDIAAIRKAQRQAGLSGQRARRAQGKNKKIPARPMGPTAGFQRYQKRSRQDQ